MKCIRGCGRELTTADFDGVCTTCRNKEQTPRFDIPPLTYDTFPFFKSKKIIEYYLCNGNSNKDLNARVNEKLKEGWELYGSINVCGISTDLGNVWQWSQAMVKYE